MHYETEHKNVDFEQYKHIYNQRNTFSRLFFNLLVSLFRWFSLRHGTELFTMHNHWSFVSKKLMSRVQPSSPSLFRSSNAMSNQGHLTTMLVGWHPLRPEHPFYFPESVWLYAGPETYFHGGRGTTIGDLTYIIRKGHYEAKNFSRMLVRAPFLLPQPRNRPRRLQHDCRHCRRRRRRRCRPESRPSRRSPPRRCGPCAGTPARTSSSSRPSPTTPSSVARPAPT